MVDLSYGDGFTIQKQYINRVIWPVSAILAIIINFILSDYLTSHETLQLFLSIGIIPFSLFGTFLFLANFVVLKIIIHTNRCAIGKSFSNSGISNKKDPNYTFKGILRIRQKWDKIDIELITHDEKGSQQSYSKATAAVLEKNGDLLVLTYLYKNAPSRSLKQQGLNNHHGWCEVTFNPDLSGYTAIYGTDGSRSYNDGRMEGKLCSKKL